MISTLRIACFSLLLLFVTCKPVQHTKGTASDSEIDALIAKEFNDKTGPGGVFLVAQHGKPVYLKAFGKANIELEVDMTTDKVFQIGSMTKQFTAVAVLMLEEQGKLLVNDQVSKFIPDYPSGDKIKLHHLLTHTSGIKDFTKMKILSEISRKEMTPAELVDVFKNEPVDFQPGEKYDYNNSGYVLLGYIIEKVSEMSYRDFIQKNIFDKAGMTHSGYATDRMIVKNRAYGYQEKETGYVNKTSISYSIPFASGALMSTAEDMLKWQNALNTHLLLKPETSAKAFSKYKLNSGEESNYGYGWRMIELNSVPAREHGGSIFGYKSMGVYIPGKDIYVLGFSNCDCNSPTQTVKDIASLVAARK
ncbi:MAG: beta-lactamase family protein [Bacteroidia bacterium]|jgi:CubicO group peptidase (beta-lactamase class C family)|nr:beta-lactamase family protein [Bacteroidia bacterium]